MRHNFALLQLGWELATKKCRERRLDNSTKYGCPLAIANLLPLPKSTGIYSPETVSQNLVSRSNFKIMWHEMSFNLRPGTAPLKAVLQTDDGSGPYRQMWRKRPVCAPPSATLVTLPPEAVTPTTVRRASHYFRLILIVGSLNLQQW
jgi:hypothetical protein